MPIRKKAGNFLSAPRIYIYLPTSPLEKDVTLGNFKLRFINMKLEFSSS